MLIILAFFFFRFFFFKSNAEKSDRNSSLTGRSGTRIDAGNDVAEAVFSEKK